jgi:hypothetical protein
MILILLTDEVVVLRNLKRKNLKNLKRENLRNPKENKYIIYSKTNLKTTHIFNMGIRNEG